MANYWDAAVVCPFFKRYKRDRLTITCEGIPHTATANLMLFENGGKADRYLENRCCKDYHQCPVARSIMEKYQE